jgi:Ca-activated chloride channel family protein
MSFGDLGMLWLVWTVPVLFVFCYWGIRRRTRILSRFSSLRGLDAIAPDACASRRWIKAGLMLAVFALLVFCLAGPRYGYHWRKIERKGVDLIVAIDCSRSMMASDIKPTRLERAKREVMDLLDLLHGDRVGLVAFSGTAFLQCPLTLDYRAYHLFLGALKPGFMPVGGTDLSAAVRTSLAAFPRHDAADKAIILITDGGATTGGDPMAAARAARAAHVRLFCIGVGRPGGVPIPAKGGGFITNKAGDIVLTRLDGSLLKRMAVVTGGSYVRSVAGGMDLEDIYFKHIRKEMRSATVSQTKEKVHEERFQWFLALAVLILAIELLVPLGRKKGTLALVLMIVVGMTSAAHAADPKAAVRKAEKAYSAGAYQKAVTHFIDAQLYDPDSAEISYDMGNAQYRTGDFKAALDSYRQALSSKDPALREKAHYNMGNALFRLGRYRKALDSYAAALKIDPKDRQTEENMQYVKRVMARPKPPQGQRRPKENGSSRKKPDHSEKGKGKPGGKEAASGKNGQKRESQPASQGPQYKSTAPDQAGAGAKKPSSAGSSGAAPGGPSEKKAHTGQAALARRKAQMDAQARQQAEQMLNRLQDEPGRAMMPTYRKRHIEKDW